MQVNFLTARKPLTKTLDSSGATLESYPLIKRFTSHHSDPTNIEEFRDLLVYYSKLKACFLKGQLVRPIKDESRAGLTNSIAPTQLLILDYDGEAVVGSIEELLYEIYPPLNECAHVIQYSASAGFDKKTALKSHIFFWLDKPVSPELLKQWVLDKNFRVQALREQLRLTANSMALRYPLDISVNQNDKLIYIAPPIISGGGKDPIKERITYVPGKTKSISLTFPATPEIANEEKLKTIAELRASLGLPKRKPATKILSGEEICTNPGLVTVTGLKKERGFIYLNLNGGDSWGYYFSEKNPSIVRNFKNEPFFYLKDAAPDLYREYSKVENGSLPGLPFVFRDPITDVYYNALINQESQNLEFMYPAKNKDRLHDFLTQYGMDIPEYIEDFDVEFNPLDENQYDLKKKWVNQFRPTEYLNTEATTDEVPKTIEKVLKHICVNEETYNHFINWLAFIYQRRTRTETAWVFQGTQGTGKGFLFSQILQPIFGEDYTTSITLETLQDGFNAYVENKFFIFVDELDIEHSGPSTSQGKIMNKLKNLITEPSIPLRGMYRNTRSVKNYANFIFASNDVAALYIAEDDRRFNVAPRQEIPLLQIDVTRQQLSKVKEFELPKFAAYLNGFKVNETKAQRALANQAKDEFIRDGKTSIQEFFLAIEDGDIQYFYSYLHKDKTKIETSNILFEARTIAEEWEEDAKKGIKSKIPIANLAKVYFAMQGSHTSMNKFGRICAKNRLKSRTIKINGKPLKGFVVEFKLPSEYTLQKDIDSVLNPKDTN